MRNLDPGKLSSALAENMRYLENILNQTFNFDHAVLSNIGIDDHHVKYTDAAVDTIVATHAAIAAAHHAKYLDSEAVTAMGVLGDGNALNHDKYTVPTWTTYAPTYTNFTLGDGVLNQARSLDLGNAIIVDVKITLGSTSSVTGLIGISLPVPAAQSGRRDFGNADMDETGALPYPGAVLLGTTTRADFYAHLTTGTYGSFIATSATVPFTWGDTDVISFFIVYEKA